MDRIEALEKRVAELEAWRAAIMPCLDVMVEVVELVGAPRTRASRSRNSISGLIPFHVPEGVELVDPIAK